MFWAQLDQDVGVVRATLSVWLIRQTERDRDADVVADAR